MRKMRNRQFSFVPFFGYFLLALQKQLKLVWRKTQKLLSGNLRIDYTAWLQTPLSLSIDRAWMQVSKRSEFQENTKLSIQDTVMVAFIVSQLKT